MELTDREKKLVTIIDYLVKANTIFAYYENIFQNIRNRRNDLFKSLDFTVEGYKQRLDAINQEFGTNYEFATQDDLTKKEVESEYEDNKLDGDQS